MLMSAVAIGFLSFGPVLTQKADAVAGKANRSASGGDCQGVEFDLSVPILEPLQGNSGGPHAICVDAIQITRVEVGRRTYAATRRSRPLGLAEMSPLT